MRVGRRDRWKAGRVGAIVLIAASASGCAVGGYNPGSLERHLIEVGVSPKAARCVVDGMTDRFGERRLGGREAPSKAELAVERQVLKKCGVSS